jgi:hypothetical protein
MTLLELPLSWRVDRAAAGLTEGTSSDGFLSGPEGRERVTEMASPEISSPPELFDSGIDPDGPDGFIAMK